MSDEFTGFTKGQIEQAKRQSQRVRSAGVVKLKYNLGQRLWPVQSIKDRHFIPFDCTIIALDGNEVTYGFAPSWGYSECDVFASEAEARAECDRRNPVKQGATSNG